MATRRFLMKTHLGVPKTATTNKVRKVHDLMLTDCRLKERNITDSRHLKRLRGFFPALAHTN